MEFWIADTFTASLARLTAQEQKAVKTTAFGLQLNPANPGMEFHKLDKARNLNFWSVRVNRDIRGRSGTLRINYRTSHQIRMQADRLLGPEVSDVDGNTEDRRGTVSVFNGPQPNIVIVDTQEDEIKKVSQWLTERIGEGVLPHEIGIFVRSAAELDRGRAAVEEAGLSFTILDKNVETTSSHVSLSSMHLAKGLEFRVVVVMACDDEIIPSQERIETVADDTDLEEVYNTERHLLYVACTRARDHLLVTSAGPASEFLDDLRL